MRSRSCRDGTGGRSCDSRRKCGGRQEPRRPARLGQLFKRESKFDKRWLAPGGSKEGNSSREAMHQSSRHGDMRIPGYGWECGAASGIVVTVYQIGEPCQTTGRSNDRVQLTFLNRSVDTVGSGELQTPFASVEVSLIRERS